MITRVAIKDYRVLGDVDIPLQPFTMLVGPNGCGKSTLMQAVHATLMHELQELEADQPDYQPWYSLLHPLQSEGMPRVEPCSLALSLEGSPVPVRIGVVHVFDVEKVGTFSEYCPHPTILNLNAQRLAEPSSLPQLRPRYLSDGYGLATELTYLSARDPDARADILASLRALIPQIDAFSISRVDRAGEFRDRLWLKTVNGNPVPAEFVSEGTLFAMAILTAFSRTSQSSRVLLVEDIDKGLHPKAQISLIAMLRELLEHRKNAGKPIQIIASTHSPFALRGLPPEAIIAMALGDDGKTRALPLSEHPEWPHWKDMMRPDEFWTMADPQWPTGQSNER